MRDLTLGSLCSGFGGLDLGLERAGFHVAWHVEPDAACSTVLDAHWPGVPNHGNVKTVDWSAVEPVYALCGGYPCQPFSHAGRRLGEDDPRHLWPFVCAAVRHLRPRIVLLENVSGHRSLGFGRVLGDLAEVGYDACWASVRASDVGAPHGRERVFIVASPRGPAGIGRLGGGGEHLARSAGAPTATRRPQRERVRDTAGGSREAVADLHGGGLEGGGEQDGGTVRPGLEAPRRGDPDRRRTAVANAASGGRGGGPTREEPRMDGRDGLSAERCEGVDLAARSPWGEYEPAIRRWEHTFGEPAPDPLDGGGRLNVDLTRWMLGFPPEWHGDTKRTHALRGYGNAVQVQVAELVGRWALS